MARIALDNVSLHFPVYSVQSRSLRSVFLERTTGGRIRKEARNVILIDALRDISLELEDGDRLAILGLNGAGKTTLLKLMGGIFEPSFGNVRREGSVSLIARNRPRSMA